MNFSLKAFTLIVCFLAVSGLEDKKTDEALASKTLKKPDHALKKRQLYPDNGVGRGGPPGYGAFSGVGIGGIGVLGTGGFGGAGLGGLGLGGLGAIGQAGFGGAGLGGVGVAGVGLGGFGMGAAPYGGAGVGLGPVLGPGYGADFGDYYGNFLADSAYDYYDWVCTDRVCQLCDVLTGDCCNPDLDRNCFLPDSCANNPCLSGGTCITTRTIDYRPDFMCICQGGLTGKYCQLVDQYYVPPTIPVPVPVATPAVVETPAYPAPAPSYGQPAAPSYGQPAAPSYGQQQVAAPAYGQQQQQMAAPAYGQQQMAAAPAYGQQQQQMAAAPASLAYGMRSLSAQKFTGFTCDCPDNGYCAQVMDKDGNPCEEYFCVCKGQNGEKLGSTYGSECNKGFKSPCGPGHQMTAADLSVPQNYFIECKNSIPFVRKCEPNHLWNEGRKNCEINVLQQRRQSKMSKATLTSANDLINMASAPSKDVVVVPKVSTTKVEGTSSLTRNMV